MKTARMATIGLTLALAACAAQPLPPSARLPRDAVEGATDPLRAAVLGSAYAFQGDALAGHPAEAARAVAMVEYMATDSKWPWRWTDYSPVTLLEIGRARTELRNAFGVATDAQPQLVINALYSAARALDAGEAPSLPVAVFPDPNLTLARLSTTPPLPITRQATSMAVQELNRLDGQRQFQGGPGGGGGRT
jgi:hypothetical protein